MKLKSFLKSLLPKNHLYWLILCAFIIVLFLIYTVVFIANICTVHIDYGEIFPPSTWVKFDYFYIAFFSILFCIVLKIALKNKIKIWPVLLCAILLPMFCYNVNYNAFNIDSPLYPLVDKGGALHFIIFKKDNYKEYYDRLFTERTSKGLVSSFMVNHPIFEEVDVTITGIGPEMDHIEADFENHKTFFKLWLNKDHTEYKKVELTAKLKDQKYADQLLFYITDERDFKEPISYTLIDDDDYFSNKKMVFIEIDAKTIEKLRNVSQDDVFRVFIQYSLVGDNQ